MMMMVVEVMLIILTAVEVLILHFLSLFLFENLKFLGRFAAELREATYDLAGCIVKTLIFGLDSTINR